ncbi:hypothetical protein [Haliangium sp.]|uniref:hypothetical protein n=1 Tax=Haliangium sp. TaxID=2663208 RepID=UPI003D0E2F61
MADPIQRPSYYEGQILAARDLSSAVDYGRDRAQRHDRLLHLWGIADGLTLTEDKRRTATGSEYVEVSVSAGVAIDGGGRELALVEDTRLDETGFRRSNVKVEGDSAWYPVFLRGSDVAVTEVGAGLSSRCGTGGSQPTRISEMAEVVFGRPGAAASLDDQIAPSVTGTAVAPWLVLLGFVQWDDSLMRFKAVSGSQDGVSPRYAGVKADVIEARAGTLAMRTKPASESGTPALAIDQQALRFGLQDGSGGLTEVFSVDRKGAITAAGKPVGGGLRIESGQLSDGLCVPLPDGVTESAVSGGEVRVHIQVSPLLALLPPTDDIGRQVLVWAPGVCFVDDDRRLHCTVRALVEVGQVASTSERPWIANYTIIAYTAGPGAGTS